MEFVLVQREVVWSGAEHLSEFTASGATKEIHLPKPIGGSRVALSKVKVLVVGSLDIGDTAFVTPDGDTALQSFYLNKLW